MDKKRLTKAVGRIGWIAGAAVFLVYGLLQGALVGGAVGLETGAYLFGPNTMADDLGPRAIAAVGMLAGIGITGAMFITCGLALGRLAGSLLAAERHPGHKNELA